MQLLQHAVVSIMGRGRFKYFVPPVLPDKWTPPGRAPAAIDVDKFKYVPPVKTEDATTTDVSKAQKRLSITANYNISSADHFVGVDTTGGPITLTLPSTSNAPSGKIYIIKDEGGNAATNNIVINTADSAKIDNLDAVSLVSNYGAISIYYNGSDWHIY